ncbi:MAG: WYL domain-containing protein, partial [Sphingobacteriales bacterium]
MPVNRNALVRYRTIDNCLRNRYKKWTLDDLIDACSDALYEFEGIDKGVSRRSIQADLEMMRSNKLGYEAPIIVVDKKYYTYADKNYSITNSPITQQDMQVLSEASGLLKQLKG